MPRIVNTINKTGSKSDRFDYLWPKKMRLKSKHYCFWDFGEIVSKRGNKCLKPVAF